jgi:hypothetical protein
MLPVSVICYNGIEGCFKEAEFAISWYPSDIFSIILSSLVDVSVMYPVELSLDVRSQVPIQTRKTIRKHLRVLLIKINN